MQQIVKTVFIEATPEVVWEFLTRREKISQWFDAAETGWSEGEEWRMLSGGRIKMWGTVLEARPNARLVMTFNHDWLNHDTRVCWDLAAKDGGTLLTLTHDGWEGCPGDVDKHIADHSEGWDKHLISLQKLCKGAAK